jgi:ribosomal protein L40E
MAEQTPQPEHHDPHHVLDADAVCAQCDEVNPAGTLICRICGNNLRDQRQRRLEAESRLMGEEQGVQAVRWLPGLLTVFGLLLITWLALNVDRVADWLVDVGSGDTVSYVWSGEEAAVFDAMLAGLRANMVAADQAYSMIQDNASRPGVTGRYVLYNQGTRQYVGSAVVEEEAAGARFVAILLNGAELRGHARYMGQEALAVDWAHGGGEAGGDKFSIHGVTTASGPCRFEGFGESTLSGQVFAFDAYCIP